MAPTRRSRFEPDRQQPRAPGRISASPSPSLTNPSACLRNHRRARVWRSRHRPYHGPSDLVSSSRVVAASVSKSRARSRIKSAVGRIGLGWSSSRSGGVGARSDFRPRRKFWKSATAGNGAEETRWVGAGGTNTCRGRGRGGMHGWNGRNGRLTSNQYASFFPLTTHGVISVEFHADGGSSSSSSACVATRPALERLNYAMCGPRRSTGSRAAQRRRVGEGCNGRRASDDTDDQMFVRHRHRRRLHRWTSIVIALVYVVGAFGQCEMTTSSTG